MSDTVLLLVADQGYLDHAKALFVGAKRQGNWQHDCCLLCPSGTDASSIEGRGIKVLRAHEPTWTYAIKFRIFAPEFRRWQRLLYLDLDVLIQGDLNRVCDELAGQFPAILMEGSQHLEGGLGTTVLQDWEHFDRLSGGDPARHQEMYANLRARFPHIDRPLFASSVMYFAPDTIPSETTEALFSVQDEFREINPRAYDQEVINVVLYDRLAPIGKGYATWFAFDEPCNRVVSVTRGWTGSENPAILHYWSAFSPWLVKTPDAGAYFNHRLNRPCRDIYLENLAAFDETFPKIVT